MINKLKKGLAALVATVGINCGDNITNYYDSNGEKVGKNVPAIMADVCKKYWQECDSYTSDFDGRVSTLSEHQNYSFGSDFNDCMNRAGEFITAARKTDKNYPGFNLENKLDCIVEKSCQDLGTDKCGMPEFDVYCLIGNFDNTSCGS
jgi:hypothetical protein